jgi:competence protein ComEC
MLRLGEMKIKYIFIILVLIISCTFSACDSSSTTTSQSTTQTTIHEETSTTSLEEPTTTPSNSTTAPSQGLEIHFIDVGQGDSILIDLGDIEVLIDGGDRSPGVTTYLSDYVDGPLEVMVATHPHADHIGGLIAVLEQYEVEEVWHNGDSSTSKTYQDFMAAVQSENAEVHIARLHNVIQAGELSFKVHHPADLGGSTNNNSIVLHLTYGTVDFLFMGDAEHEAEENMMMLNSLPVPEIEILKVGHHGSRTASSKDFLTITSPEVAIYMAGEDNTYGHPHEETITDLNDIGAIICGTDTHGTIVVITNGKTYTIQSQNPKPPVISASITIPSENQSLRNLA